MNKILLFLCKGFEHLEAAPFIDVFGWAGTYCNSGITVTTCGFKEKTVSAFDVGVNVNVLIDRVDVSEYDALAIPGGFGEFGFYEDAYDESFLELIRKFAEANKPVAAVCVAAKSLGKAGILFGRKSTTYHLDNKKHQKQLSSFKGVSVIPDERIVVDGNIITSSCPQTAPHVAFLLLELLKGNNLTNEVRNLMGYDFE